jgi:hypothetical protein
VWNDFTVVEGVIAKGDGVCTRFEDGIRDLRGHAKAASRILGVYDHAISLEAASKGGQGFDSGSAPCATKQIAKKEYFHHRVLRRRC